ncbi:Sel1 repeat-containing protein [Fluviicoccus keumensis]|uniref:Sel1 repeat-containing protein n=1 Tax=Fluviicoccus keumensis TaxID=1435465 RepID=A0A4Q7Z9Y0_9GAMM|nr:SEL1-like repeat protein [Fluviicoccus keumensis]RZU47372.1 Sel1 repeat-containing protein [Fluviicoccus keumensis]
MKTVADLFANDHVVLGKVAPVDRHFVHVEKMPAEDEETACTWIKSVEPGQLQNEYWVAREKNLLLLLKKLPQVVHLRKDDDNSDSSYHTVRTRDAGVTLDAWLKMKPQHIASGRTLEHPFAHVGAFLRLARGLLTALKSIHREGVIHAHLDGTNICLPYAPFPFRFDTGIRPDFANVCLIDFMFAVSSTLRLYRPMAITPLAPPSAHSALLRNALETDAALQRAEAIQEIDYSVDLYALGHVLEDIFQRGLIYPGNMQSQMEMTIYNLIHELLGYDDGIPEALAEKYGSTMPHDIYIKRIDNMLTLDPHVDNDDHDMLLLDPAQVLDPEAPEEETLPVATPHQPADEPVSGTLPADPLLVTASADTPEMTAHAPEAAASGLRSYLEISKWMVVGLLLLVQGMHFLYSEGGKMGLDVVPSLLLMLAIAVGVLVVALVAVPRDQLLKYVEGDDDLPGGGYGQGGFAQTPLRDDEYITVNAYVIVALLLTGQICSVIYEHGENMKLDVVPSMLLAVLIGVGSSVFKIWYDKFMAPKPLNRIDDDIEETDAPEPEAVAAEVMAESTGIAAAATVAEAAFAVQETAEAPAEDAPVAAVADIVEEAAPAPAAIETAPEADVAAAAPQAGPAPVEAPAVVAEEVVIAVAAPVVAVAAEAAVMSETVASAPAAAAAELPLAARTVHEEEPVAAALSADGTAAATDGHLELDNRIVIVVVLLLLLLFFYFSVLHHSDNTNTLPAAAPAPAPEVTEAAPAEEPGLPEAAPVEPEAPTSMPADTTALDSLLQSHAPVTAARPAKVKPAKTATAPKDAATEAAPAETATAQAAPAEAAPAPAEAAPAAAPEKPADKPAAAAVAEAPAAPAKPLGNPLAQAQNIMGWYYFKGINNVPQDYTEALKWFHKSAQLGDPSGQFNLGMMYANGYGIGKNQAEAARWFKLSADQGKANAQLNLGMMYLAGRGVAQNTEEGMRLLRLSAGQGDKNAQAYLDTLEKSGKAPTP